MIRQLKNFLAIFWPDLWPDLAASEFETLRRESSPAVLPSTQCEPWCSEAEQLLEYVPRSLIVLRAKAPYLNWVRKVDPLSSEITLKSLREKDALAFLVPQQLGTASESERFIEVYWPECFAQALEQIAIDRQHWPPELSLAMLRDWFDIEFCQAIIDVGLGDAVAPEQD